jgi:hypothetical protein
MNVVVDGVIFQRGETGIGRVWSAALAALNEFPDLHVTLLDRGGAPPLQGIERVQFPSYKWNANTAADSLLLERICQEINADVFSSTFYTTPTTIPSVVMLGDMLANSPEFELSRRQEQERQIAITFASYYVCGSERARTELETSYPGTLARSVVVPRSARQPAQSPSHDSESMASYLYQLFKRAHEEGRSAARQAFVREWARLRTIQAAVDPCRLSDL